MDDRTNTIAGWVLASGALVVFLATATGEYFHSERPEKMGYEVQGVEAEAGTASAPAKPFAFYMASGDAQKGAEVFKKCTACHNADKGGPNALGPNLWGVVGEAVAVGRGGYAFSDALKSKGGTWTFDTLNQWLESPKGYAPGTKMTFAGLSKPEDRANVIAYLNKQSDKPQPLPSAPAAGAEAGKQDTPAPAGADALQKAKNVPVQTEAQAAKQPKGNVAGEGAPATSGLAKDRRE